MNVLSICGKCDEIEVNTSSEGDLKNICPSFCSIKQLNYFITIKLVNMHKVNVSLPKSVKKEHNKLADNYLSSFKNGNISATLIEVHH